MMEMNRLWEAKDFKALTKRIYHGSGCAATADKLSPEEKEELRKLAEACQEYLRVYERISDK